MHLSYAQFLEDYHLDRVLGDRQGAAYIDVGGGHPLADNVSYHFYLKGWRGLIIEPQGNLAALYRHLRPRDIVLDVLVGAGDGEVPFHRVDRLHGFSTIVKANAEGAAAFGAGFRTEMRPIRRLSGLIDSHGIGPIAFLKIDVEGAEAEVLRGVDWARHRPSVLCIEAIQPGTGEPAWDSWEPIVLSAGYTLALADGINRFYVAAEESYLAERFPEKPAPWDCVRHYYELGPALDRPDHPDRALLQRLLKGFLAGLGRKSPEEILALIEASAGPDGLEAPGDLVRLLRGNLPAPEGGTPVDARAAFDDHARAAIGRLAAFYDGGMITEEEAAPDGEARSVDTPS
ncbi:MAG: FkbM family methyltransferase [Beijerinckiaceae bacterium]|nr:FkbM family methyltransferase [Beijerinckiaceae bacterium]MCZ8301863.1 FkbM family methyltransferase [Beijerinckiaceae bacterium]